MILDVRRINANTGLVAGVADPVDQFGILLDVHVLVWATGRDVMQHAPQAFYFGFTGIAIQGRDWRCCSDSRFSLVVVP